MEKWVAKRFAVLNFESFSSHHDRFLHRWFDLMQRFQAKKNAQFSTPPLLKYHGGCNLQVRINYDEVWRTNWVTNQGKLPDSFIFAAEVAVNSATRYTLLLGFLGNRTIFVAGTFKKLPVAKLIFSMFIVWKKTKYFEIMKKNFVSVQLYVIYWFWLKL